MKTHKTAARAVRQPSIAMAQPSLQKVTVRLTEAQLSRFKEAAEQNGCEPGDALLAMACQGIEIGPAQSNEDVADFFRAQLWRFVAERVEPKMADAWACAGFATTEDLKRIEAEEEQRKTAE